MNLTYAFTQADAVAWTCFGAGIVLLLGGVAIGLWTSLQHAPQKAKEARAKLEEASAKIEEAQERVRHTASAAAESNLETFTASATDAKRAAAEAEESTKAAKTAIEQVQGIIGALPENLRFAGLLILVGAVLISVATVQFGGHSLF